MAGGAGLATGTGFSAAAVAILALLELGEGDFLFDAHDGFFESDLHVVAQIGAALGAGGIGVAAAAEKIVENTAAATAAAEDFAEDFEWIVEAAGSRTEAAGTGIEGAVAVLIVGGALLGIAEDFVGFADFLEFFLGGFVAGIFIGMVFNGEFAVRLFDVVDAGAAFDTEHFVVIAFGHGFHGFLATTTIAGRIKRSRKR